MRIRRAEPREGPVARGNRPLTGLGSPTNAVNPITPFLDQQGVVILDGGLATELERRGADLRDPLWSAKLLLENPDLIRQVHLDYFRAGAEVATTASYQATLPGLL